MKQNHFGWILLLMALSTLALLGMQTYWLWGQYLQQQAALHRDALKAIAGVSSEINRRNSFVTQTDDKQTYDFQAWSADSTRVFIFASNISDWLDQPDTSLQQLRRQQAKAILAEINRHPAPQPRTPNKDLFETVLFRSVQQCAHCDSEQSLSTRYALDRMTKQALELQGIQLPFELGLRSHPNGSWNALYPTQADTTTLLESPLKLVLLGNREELYLHFPDQNNWMLAHLGKSFFASIGLLSIIFGSFFYAWRIIRQQKKLSEMKNDFINNMTHEFKTPIATIAFATANINNPQVLNSPDDIQQFTRIIRDENNRLNQQVEKVLQTALADRKAFKIKWQQTALLPLLQPVLAAAELRVLEKGGRFQLQADEAEGLTIWTDAFHLANIINNLLDNAIKYSHAHPPELSLRIHPSSSRIEFVVADRGIGIGREDLPYIFDKFYRAHTGDIHHIKGFGLGLSYVRGITEQLGGQVSVDSRLGEGSTFTLSIPFLKPDTHV